jgi:hypothetical protein
MKLLTLSDDLINLMGTLLTNNELAKLVYYTQANPLSQPNFNIVEIAPFGKKERILPHPFDIDYTEDVRSQIHIYFPVLEFENNQIVEDCLVFIDVVVHTSIWTIVDSNGRKKIRPYEIARNIIHELKDICSFQEMTHLAVNDQFQALRIQGQIIKWNDLHADNY